NRSINQPPGIMHRVYANRYARYTAPIVGSLMSYCVMMRSVPATDMLMRLKCVVTAKAISSPTICQRTQVGPAPRVSERSLDGDWTNSLIGCRSVDESNEIAEVAAVYPLPARQARNSGRFIWRETTRNAPTHTARQRTRPPASIGGLA